MAPERPTHRFRLLLACALGASLTLASAPAHALRLLDYNVLNYPGSTGATRDSSFRRILAPLSPDVFVAEEMTSQAGTTEFLNSLNIMEPGEWAALPFIDGNDTDCAMFYKPAKFDALGQWAFYPDPTTIFVTSTSIASARSATRATPPTSGSTPCTSRPLRAARAPASRARRGA